MTKSISILDQRDFIPPTFYSVVRIRSPSARPSHARLRGRVSCHLSHLRAPRTGSAGVHSLHQGTVPGTVRPPRALAVSAPRPPRDPEPPAPAAPARPTTAPDSDGRSALLALQAPLHTGAASSGRLCGVPPRPALQRHREAASVSPGGVRPPRRLTSSATSRRPHESPCPQLAAGVGRAGLER